jgi:hypothetical protein
MDSARSEESMTGQTGNVLAELATLREQLDFAQKTLLEQNAIQRQGALLDEISKEEGMV